MADPEVQSAIFCGMDCATRDIKTVVHAAFARSVRDKKRDSKRDFELLQLSMTRCGLLEKIYDI